MRRVSTGLATLALVATVLLGTANPASAANPGRVLVRGTTLVFQAGSATANDVELTRLAGTVIISDAHPITSFPVGVCAQPQNIGSTAVECLMSPFTTLEIQLGTERDVFHGTEALTLAVLVYGQAGPDELHGGDMRETLDGGYGDDTVNGGAGNDHLLGGPNRDTLDGGPGDDLFEGGLNVDRIFARDFVDETVNCGGGLGESGDFYQADLSEPKDTLISCEIPF